MIDGIQDVVVTIVAAGAAVVIVRRVMEFVAPAKRQPPCGSCGPACAAKPSRAADAAAHVLHLVRRRPNA